MRAVISRARVRDSDRRNPTERFSRWAIYLYVDLWVLEGALRKWIPGLGDIGYVARDGIAIVAIILIALAPRRRSRSIGWLWVYVTVLLVLGGVQVIADLISLPVMLVGLRSYVALALLPALVWQSPDAVDLARFSRRILFHLPLQAVLVAAQVMSPPNAPINWQVTADTAGFVNFGGVVRATGTFTAPSGLGAYLGIAAAVALLQILSARRSASRYAVVCVALCLFCAALGGDRSTLITIVATLLVFAISLIFAAPRGAQPITGRVIGLGLIIGTALAVVFSLFSTVVDSFFRRFEHAAQSEDTFERVLRQSFGFAGRLFDPGVSNPLIGDGMGAHAQAGIALGSPYPWIEIEVIRWVAELGILGYLLAWLRLILAGVLIVASVRALARKNVALPVFSFLLISVMVPGLVTQTPSTQAAFGVMSVLIILAWPHGFPDRSRMERPRGVAAR